MRSVSTTSRLVPDRAALEAWAQHLDDLGVAHSGVLEEQAGPLIVFRDPDNIQLESWAFDAGLVRPGLQRHADVRGPSVTFVIARLLAPGPGRARERLGDGQPRLRIGA